MRKDDMLLKTIDTDGVMAKMKDGLLLCPFCGDEVEEIQDDCGGACIEHKSKHRNGGIQKCVLTDTQINTSSKTYIEWNDRVNDTLTLDMDAEKMAKELEKTCLKNISYDLSGYEYNAIANSLIQNPTWMKIGVKKP